MTVEYSTIPAPVARRRRILLALSALALLVIVGAGAFSLVESRSETGGRRSTLPLGAASPSGQGSMVEPPRALSNFTLTDQRGQAVSLADLRGKAVLLFFGFTNCPSICPTTMAEFRAAKRSLGPDGDRVAAVLISVDPERDTPERLGQYLGAFDPSFVGLRGDTATLGRIGPEYDLYYERQPLGDGEYTIDHTAISYLIDPEGRLRTVYPYGTPGAGIATDLRAILVGR
jgi:protein SCO1/2